MSFPAPNPPPDSATRAGRMRTAANLLPANRAKIAPDALKASRGGCPPARTRRARSTPPKPPEFCGLADAPRPGPEIPPSGGGDRGGNCYNPPRPFSHTHSTTTGNEPPAAISDDDSVRHNPVGDYAPVRNARRSRSHIARRISFRGMGAFLGVDACDANITADKSAALNAERENNAAPVRRWTGRALARAFGDSPAPRRR